MSRIEIHTDGKDEPLIIDDVFEFALVGTMASPKVQIPIFKITSMHDRSNLLGLLAAMTEHVRTMPVQAPEPEEEPEPEPDHGDDL